MKDRIDFSETIAGSYSFTRGVVEGGYELLSRGDYTVEDRELDKTDRGPKWLARRASTEPEYVINQYTPLALRALHRKFAHLQSEEEVLAFANRYGLLGIKAVSLRPNLPHEHIGRYGESIGRWKAEIRDMAILQILWDMVNRGEVGKLGQLIKWTPDNKAYIEFQAELDDHGEWQLSAILGKEKKYPLSEYFLGPDPTSDIRLRKYIGNPYDWPRGSIVEPAKLYIFQEVNKKMEKHVTPQILLPTEPGAPLIYLFPDSLLAAFWVLFLMEITGHTRLGQCICGTWVERSLIRGSHSYCSDACKQKAHRINKRLRDQTKSARKCIS